MMRKLASILTLLCFAVTFVAAQNTDNAAKATQKADGPVMTFEEDVIDYGTIEQDSDPFRIFKFKNTGDEPLVITKAQGSCGCTTPEWPKEPILPGESAEIKVKYDTHRIGRFTKTVTLTTNAAQPTKVLRIKGEVLRKDMPKSVPEQKSGGVINNNNN